MRTIVGLAVVIGVIYGLTWVLKQVKSSKRGDAPRAPAWRPSRRCRSAPNRSLHLVRAGDEIVLVGAGEHGVTPIRTYTEAEARALGLLEDEPRLPMAAEPVVRRATASAAAAARPSCATGR